MAWFHSVSLAVLSFLPLWLLIFTRGLYVLLKGSDGARNAEWCAAIGIPVMLVFSAIVAHWFFRHLHRKSSGHYTIHDCKEEKTITLEFLAANVFPLLCFDTTQGEGLALTLTYFLVIASLSVRHKYFPANIWLEWFGWTFWRCSVSNKADTAVTLERVVVSRHRILKGRDMELVSINNETLADLSKADKSKESE